MLAAPAAPCSAAQQRTLGPRKMHNYTTDYG
jgi:hypothetical protein